MTVAKASGSSLELILRRVENLNHRRSNLAWSLLVNGMTRVGEHDVPPLRHRGGQLRMEELCEQANPAVANNDGRSVCHRLNHSCQVADLAVQCHYSGRITGTKTSPVISDRPGAAHNGWQHASPGQRPS